LPGNPITTDEEGMEMQDEGIEMQEKGMEMQRAGAMMMGRSGS
jgi:hypothetical protein